MIFKKRFSKTLSATATISVRAGQPVRVDVEWDGTPNAGMTAKYQAWMLRCLETMANRYQTSCTYIADKPSGVEAWACRPGQTPELL